MMDGIEECVAGFPDLYNVWFYGHRIETLVTYDPSRVIQWINETEFIHRRRLHHLVVGLDVEWRPNRYRGQRNPVATLQLCVGHRCLIFQPLYCSQIPDALYNFLSDSNYTFVGVGIQTDLELLSEDHELDVTNAVDLRTIAANEFNDRSLANAGLKRLAETYMGADLDKPRRVTLSDWARDSLTLEQIQYACIDAYVSFEIGRIANASVHDY